MTLLTWLRFRIEDVVEMGYKSSFTLKVLIAPAYLRGLKKKVLKEIINIEYFKNSKQYGIRTNVEIEELS